MSMGITLSENGNKAKDISLNAIAFTVGLDQSLACQFGSPIKGGLDGKCSVFRSRKDFRLSVDRTGGGKGNVLNVIGSHPLQHMERGKGVLFQIFAWMLSAKSHIRVRGKMKDKFSSLHGLRQ